MRRQRFLPGQPRSTRSGTWCRPSGCPDTGCAAARDRYGRTQHTYGQPGRLYRNPSTGRRMDAGRYDLARYARTADHVVQLEHGGRAFLTHVFDSVLVTDVVGTLDGIVHVPAPVIVRVGGRDGAGDATLGRYGVGTRWEHFGDHGSIVTALGQLQRCAHASTAATNNDGVEGNSWNVSHESDTPKNLHTPDEVSEHRDAAYCLEEETDCSRGLAQRHRRQVVSRDGPHADPGVSAKSCKCQQTEDSHRIVGKQAVPLLIANARVCDEVSDQENEISRENDRRHTLRHPVIEA